MSLIRKLLLQTTALPALLVGPAMAADLPLKAPPAAPIASYDWSGFYVGLNAGGDWARSDTTTSASCVGAPGFPFGSYFNCGDIPTINGLGTGSMSGSGFTGGAQAGYNWQFNSAVLGVETDFEALHAKASRTTAGPIFGGGGLTATVTDSVSANWLFTARARLGWAVNNNLLVYGTGGLAVTHLSASNVYSDNSFLGGAGAWSASATKAGWTAGAGVEWAFSQHWSARAEYLYVHFDAITATGVVGSTLGVPGGYGSAISTSSDLSVNIARAAVNYKF